MGRLATKLNVQVAEVCWHAGALFRDAGLWGGNPFRGLHYGDYASVMVSSLEEVNGFICDPVDQPVFLADTARPAACQHIFERLRLSQPLEWIPHHCLLKFLDAVPLPFQAWSALALLAATPIGDAVRCVASVRGVQFP
jgi:hypothetical protein